jgi:uncharacterized membrane protein
MNNLFTLIIVLLILDIIWIQFVMKNKYELIFNEILKDKINFRLLPAIFTYSVMIFALYYFALKNSKTSTEALINGSLLGFIMYGVYDGTMYAFLPINDYYTGLLDITWGTFVCGISAYIAFDK